MQRWWEVSDLWSGLLHKSFLHEVPGQFRHQLEKEKEKERERERVYYAKKKNYHLIVKFLCFCKVTQTKPFPGKAFKPESLST